MFGKTLAVNNFRLQNLPEDTGTTSLRNVGTFLPKRYDVMCQKTAGVVLIMTAVTSSNLSVDRKLVYILNGHGGGGGVLSGGH